MRVTHRKTGPSWPAPYSQHNYVYLAYINLTMLPNKWSFLVLAYSLGITFAAPPIVQPDLISQPSSDDPFLPFDVSDATTYVDSNITTALDAYYLRIYCFKQKSPMTLGRVVMMDYYQTIDKVLTIPDAMAYRPWNLGTGRVTGWTSNKVVVGVRVPYPPAPEKFPPVMVAHAAALISKTCVNAQNGYLGGWTTFGTGNQFAVNVAAKP